MVMGIYSIELAKIGVLPSFRKIRSTRDLFYRRIRLFRHGANLKNHVVNASGRYNLSIQQLNFKNVIEQKTSP
jgi:hypothetical protein